MRLADRVPPPVGAALNRAVDVLIRPLLLPGRETRAFSPPATSTSPRASLGALAAACSGGRRGLLRDDPSGIARYARFTELEYDDYLRARSAYYGAERRGPDSPFWQRRLGEPPRQESSMV
jgi:hypothetical protein